MPDVFVMKIPNYMMESIDWGKTIFSMCDIGFRQENYFYDKLHAKHPIALPKMFWIGEEPNPSPETTMPRASILMAVARRVAARRAAAAGRAARAAAICRRCARRCCTSIRCLL